MTINNVLELVGVLVPLLSTVASWFNGAVRTKMSTGQEIPPFVAKAGAVLNVGAMNFDKAAQLLKVVAEALPKKEDAAAEKKAE